MSSSKSNSHNTNSSSESTLPRLGPTWRSSSQGRGFQPPPAVPPNDHSNESNNETKSSSRNSFSLLDMDNDDNTSSSTNNHKSDKPTPTSSSGGGGGGGRFMSRSEGLRSSGTGSGGFSTRASKLKGSGTGRSLADLASRFTPASSGSAAAAAGTTGSDRDLHGMGMQRERSSGGMSIGSGGGLGLGGGRHHSERGSGSERHHHHHRERSERGNVERTDLIDDKSVVRYTRERLLSMRPRPGSGNEQQVLPTTLTCLEGTALFAKDPLDPVCWDNFDANEIWKAARERSSRSASKQSATVSGSSAKDLDNREDHHRRGSLTHHHHDNTNTGGDTWRRGVALPPPGEGNHSTGNRRNGSRYDDIADNPDDLWDDPSQPTSMAAASDFSAFGGALDDEPLKVSSSSNAFDLAQMSKAAQEFEEDLRRGSSSGASSVSNNSDSENNETSAINSARPLASEGTTIRSGSGDDVNVFEDFGEPESKASSNSKESSAAPIKSGDEQSASSRLMQMIGVGGGEAGNNNSNDSSGNGDGEPTPMDDPTQKENTENVVDDAAAASGTESGPTSLFSFSSGISKNPWGNPSSSTSTTSNTQQDTSSFGLDLAAKLRDSQQQQQVDMHHAESERLKREEIERMRLREVEEEQRRAALLAQQQQQQQQQAELHMRQQAAAREQQQKAQQQQQAQQANAQIELILTDRIATVLENSWGRSDLVTVLSTLHNEDARVVPLLGTVDALRALVARHPRRFALMKDPSMGTEVAVLIVNNATWQQHKQAEDLQRRQQEQQMLAAQQEAANRIEAEKKMPVITDSPWYYADPQGNVQGPFGGEEMRQWLEAGYFKGDLPISQDPKGQFRQLSSLFPDMEIAFKPTGPSESELAAKAEAEEHARLKAEAEAAAIEAEEKAKVERERIEKEKAEAEARAKVEAAAAQAEAEARKQQLIKEQESQSNQNQSAQLKMLLGLGGDTSSSIGGIINDASNERKEQQPQSKISKPATSDSRKANGNAKTQVPAVLPQPLAPAWGGAGTNKPAVRQKSMSEIQQEEARVAARVAKQKPQSSGGWANIAASGGTTAWSGNATIITSAPAVPAMTSTSNSQSGVGVQSRTKQNVPSAPGQKQTKNQSSTQKTMEEFGANGMMTPALEDWCKQQMRKLSGNDDLTLIAFCMTLSDPVEIKGYLTAYLGSTPQVISFASEFINRKNGTKQQEQWETTGGSKKGRKKKGAVAK